MLNEIDWIRPNADFKFLGKMKADTIILINSENLSEEFYNYSKMFNLAANKIIDYLLTTAKKNADIAKLDTWFFSTVYLYRQSLELILKSIIFKQVIEKREQKVLLSQVRHNLSECLEVILENLSVNEMNNMCENLLWIRTYFEDITQVDEQSDMFRYPFSNKMDILFKEQTHVNLVVLKQNMNTAFNIIKDMLVNGHGFIGNYQAYQPKLIVAGGNYYEQSVLGYKFSGKDFYPYFKSYQESANCLKDIILKENNESLFLPMCYLYRNAVELGLKRILLEDTNIPYDKALDIMRKKKHSVRGLWNAVEVEIDKNSNQSMNDITMECVTRYIQQLHDLDSSSSKFRYPVDKNFKIYFPKKITFSVSNIADCFNELCNFLDCVDDMLSDVREIEKEIQTEWYADMISNIDYS